jgi:protein TonB
VKKKPAETPEPQRLKASPAPPSTDAVAARPQAAAAAPSGEQEAVIEAAEDARQRYLGALISAIHRKKHYPRAARTRRDEGKVVVSFVIRKTGRLEDIRIARSSGSDLLDGAALKTIRRVDPFRPLPDELGKESWALAVPIAFSLKD